MSTEADLVTGQRDAARIAGRSELSDVRMFNTSARILNMTLSDSPFLWSLEMTPAIEWNQGDDYFVLQVDYRVRIGQTAENADQPDPAENADQPDHEDDGDVRRDATGGEDATPIAVIKFRLGGLFHLCLHDMDKAISSSELDAYAKTIGSQILYPYAREYVQDVTGRFGLPPLTMSVHRLPSPWRRDGTVREAEAGLPKKRSPRKSLPREGRPRKRSAAG